MNIFGVVINFAERFLVRFLNDHIVEVEFEKCNNSGNADGN